jgi:hypothetical protein
LCLVRADAARQVDVEDAQARVKAEFGEDDGTLDDEASQAVASMRKQQQEQAKAASAQASLAAA